MEHDDNRSSAMSAETIATTNTVSSAVLKDALAAMMKEIMVPMLTEMQRQSEANALTPEKIALLKAPYVDPKAAAREERESAMTKEQEAENIRLREAMRASCLHTDPQGRIAVCLVHNFPDRQPRGICPICQDLIHPKEWVIGAPDPRTGKTKPYLRDAHKDYRLVLQLEAGRPAGAM